MPILKNNGICYTLYMTWFPLVLISVFISSFANVLQRVLMKGYKSDPVSYAIIFCLLLGVFNLFFAFFHGFRFPSFGTHLFFFLGSAILWGVGTVLSFKAYQLLESSEVTILTSVRILVTIIASIIFLHDIFTIQRSLGTLIILGSIIVVANLKKGMKFSNGTHYAFASTLFNGLAVVFDTYNVKGYDPISYLAIINILIAFVLLVVYPKTVQKWKNFTQPHFLKSMLPLAFLSTLQSIAYYFALSKGHASQIAPINQAQVIITVLLAAVLLNEKDNLQRKFIASILATAGILLLM